MKDLITEIREEIAKKQAEIQILTFSLENLLRSNEEVCTHPNLKRTPFEHDCPDCSYYRERSF
jgi:hypothetical protein